MPITMTGPGNYPITIRYIILCNLHHDPPNHHFTDEDTRVQRDLVTYPRLNSEHGAETGGKHRQPTQKSPCCLYPSDYGEAYDLPNVTWEIDSIFSERFQRSRPKGRS